MSSRMARSGLCWITPDALRKLSPSIRSGARPSANSLIVKSNSLRPTKSIAADAFRLSSGWTATLAPTKPTLSDGFASFIASATRTSLAKDGVEVWSTSRS